nr:PREDICTED: tetraspanin-2A [Bemisia tabaci]
MTGRTASVVRVAADKLERNINIIKYSLFCFNVIAWILGITLLAFCLYLRTDTEFQEWIDILEIWSFNYGLYILILIGFIILFVPCVGCASVYQEQNQILMINAGMQMFCFLALLIGSAFLLENSTVNSRIQGMIRNTVTRMILYSVENDNTERVLNAVQENIGCCGADGPMDYVNLNRALPTECRDTVTGNAFFHGCVDEVTWYLEEKSEWITGIAVFLSTMHVLIAVLNVVLKQALELEEKMPYRR